MSLHRLSCRQTIVVTSVLSPPKHVPATSMLLSCPPQLSKNCRRPNYQRRPAVPKIHCRLTVPVVDKSLSPLQSCHCPNKPPLSCRHHVVPTVNGLMSPPSILGHSLSPIAPFPTLIKTSLLQQCLRYDCIGLFLIG